MLGRAVTGGCAFLCAALAACATAVAAPQPPFGHAGRFITDAKGRVFTSHGVNLVYKLAPYEPSVTGFGEDDAAFLAREGFNSVRLGVIYKAVEPQPGVYDERFQGEGWPDWAVLDDGLPAQPQAGFPGNYLAQPAVNRAFDNFWANA